MATTGGPTSTTTIILERTDVDKSLKALENVVTLCVDYCQLATTLASMNKKLARALKDTASIKSITQYPGNALSSAAHIFESTGEVESKFCRVIERELGTMNELKKWIKKLRKEDKALEEYTMSANAKIKNAGMAYEKKAKRRDKDAADEHIRYTTLLSTLVSEMASAKHQHALFVTSKHTATLYSISASMARVAESHWVRTCETLRTVAVNIGPMAENRAYLEGGYMSAPPSDLTAPPDNPSLPLSISTAGTLSSSSRQSDSPTHTRNVLTKNTISANALDQITDELRAALVTTKPQETEKAANKTIPEETSRPTLQQPPVDSAAPKSPALSIPPPLTASPLPASPIEPTKDSNSSATENTDVKFPEPQTTKPTTNETKDVKSSKSSDPKSTELKAEPKTNDRGETAARPPRIPTPPKETKPEPLLDTSRIGMTSTKVRMLSNPGKTVSQPAPVTPLMALPKSQVASSPPPTSPRLLEMPPIMSSPSTQFEDRDRLLHRPFARRTSLTSNGTPSPGNGLVAAMKDRYVEIPKSPPPPPEPISQNRELPRPQSRVSDLAARFNPPEQLPQMPGGYPSYSRLPPDLAGSRYPRAAMPGSPPPPPALSPHPNQRWAASSDNLPIRTPLMPPQHTGRTLEEFGIMPPETQPPLSLPSRDLRTRDRERDRDRDWREEELELEQRELELKLHRQRLLLAREREQRDREVGYFTDKDRYERELGNSSLRPPQRGYTTSPLPTSASREDLVLRHSPGREYAHRTLDSRDMQRGGTPYSPHPQQQQQQQHGPGCQCADCVSGRYGTQSPSSSSREGPVSNAGTTKERGWLGKGLKRLSMPLIQPDSSSNRLRTSMDRNESAYSIASSRNR